MDENAPECIFCGWVSSVPGWIVRHERAPYGRGPRSEGDYRLCQFCYRSFAASRWLSGPRSENDNVERDQLMIANMLLAAQGIEAINALMKTLEAQPG